MTGLGLAISACSPKPVIKPDDSPFATDSNYDTLQFEACQQLNYGVGFCSTKEDERVKVNIKTTGYTGGKITLSGCGESRWEYTFSENTDHVSISLAPIKSECVAAFTLSPTLIGQVGSMAVVGSIRGRLYLEPSVLGKESKSKFSQVKEHSDLSNEIFSFEWPNEAAEVKMVSRGDNPSCKNSLKKTYKSDNGEIKVPLSDILQNNERGRCIVKGTAKDKDLSKTLTWAVSSYANNFKPLEIPSINWNGSKLCVKSEESVALLVLDQEKEVASKACFKANFRDKHQLRVLTSSGRGLVGEWNPEVKGWKWFR